MKWNLILTAHPFSTSHMIWGIIHVCSTNSEGQVTHRFSMVGGVEVLGWGVTRLKTLEQMKTCLSDCSIRPHELGQRAVISPDWSPILPDMCGLRAAASAAGHAGKYSCLHAITKCNHDVHLEQNMSFNMTDMQMILTKIWHVTSTKKPDRMITRALSISCRLQLMQLVCSNQSCITPPKASQKDQWEKRTVVRDVCFWPYLCSKDYTYDLFSVCSFDIFKSGLVLDSGWKSVPPKENWENRVFPGLR